MDAYYGAFKMGKTRDIMLEKTVFLVSRLKKKRTHKHMSYHLNRDVGNDATTLKKRKRKNPN